MKEMPDKHIPKGVYEKYLKRFFDFLISTFTLILLSPVILIIALFVRIFLGKPVIFKQKRPGKDEQVFELYKFRSMTDKTDGKGELLPDELRLTTFGKLLRATSLDELPELLNILKGDMAIVGPRPLLMKYLPFYTEEERHRHDVRPGLTGLAQVNGRNFINWETRFRYDLEYVQNITFKNDINILWQTVFKVIKHSDIMEDSTQVDFKNLDEERKSI